MAKKHKKVEPATVLVPQASPLKKTWDMLKTRPAKIAGAVGVGIASLAVAFHATLLNFPQLVTENGEEFAQRHKIPPELLKGFDLKNIRVYKDNRLLIAMHAASIHTVDAARNGMWPYEAYTSSFDRFYEDNGSRLNNFPNGECVTSIGKKTESIKKLTFDITGIPEKDLELSPQITPDILFYETVLHEFSHTERRLYGTNENGFACAGSKKKGNYFSDTKTLYEIREQKQRSEVVADHDALVRLEPITPELRDYTTATRAVSAFSYPEEDDGYRLSDDVHDTAIYLQALRKQKPQEAQPDIEFKQTENLLLYKYASREARKYEDLKPKRLKESSVKIPRIYMTYMGMLDVIEDHESGRKRLIDNMYQTALLFRQGLEFLAPKKAKEFQQKRTYHKSLTENPALTIN